MGAESVEGDGEGEVAEADTPTILEHVNEKKMKELAMHCYILSVLL